MIDKIITTLMITSFIACLFFVSFEMGKKHQCEKDKDYVFSYDYSKCIKIGKESLR
jgi:hypothetical protein